MTKTAAPKLLDLADPTYLRRLVREINSILRSGLGVYGDIMNHRVRIKRARFAQDVGLVLVSFNGLEGRCDHPDQIEDGNGQHVCASRKR